MEQSDLVAFTTLDVDILVDLDVETVVLLCAAFPDPEFYVNLSTAEEAVRRRRQFNVIQPKTGLKIDFIVARDDEWGRQQLARRKRVEIFPEQWGYTAAPEDVILGKLLYYKEGQSEKHLRDIAGMLSVSGDLIDREDISTWASQLDVFEIWQKIIQRVDAART